MRVKGLILLLVLLLSLFSICYAVEFTDLGFDEGSQSYKVAVENLCEKGAITGYPDGTFKPSNNITRAEITKIIIKAFDIELVDSGETNFKDIDPNKWYASYVNTGVKNRFIVGYEDNTFRPDENVSYAELVTMICNVMKEKVSSKEGTKWYEAYWNTASDKGFFKNYNANDLLPDNKAKRISVALITYNALNGEKIEEKKDEEKKEEKQEETVKETSSLSTSKYYAGVVETQIEARGKDFFDLDVFGEGLLKISVLKSDKMPNYKSLLIFKVKSNNSISIKKELKIKDLDNNYLLVIEVDDDAVSFEGTKEYLDIAEAKIKYNGSNLNLNKYTFFEIDVDPNNQDEYEFTGCEVKALKDVKFKKDDRVIFDVSNKLCYVIKGMEKED
ncbi:MAG: S-layer homology domain-containing protein [Clostridia bacterium]|nr:S-layer homology domain-containing protein [Clostridia bacterium]